MIRRIVAFLTAAWAIILPALADTARVYSGEHDDFTRLVVEFSSPQSWTVGRMPMGYGFATDAAAQPDFDLSQVWTRIPRTRLQALRIAPETGALILTLACDCHVFPFEYQPGIVVIDIKGGSAPEGSVFEEPFHLPGESAFAAMGPVEQGFDWLESRGDESTAKIRAEAIALPAGTASLDPLRRVLLAELSRGAAQGVVDMVLPETPPDMPTDEVAELPWSQIHIGPPPDTRLDAVAEGKEGRTPDGEDCAPEAALAIADWGSEKEPAALLAEARSDLYGEFDSLNPEAVQRAVRAHLYLGFGAEALQYLDLLPKADAVDDQAYLRSLALLVDGSEDPKSPFADMASCDGPAALWALLAGPVSPARAAVNSKAVVRGFMALPPHLRAFLGPGLNDRLLALGDAETARIVRNTLKRTPDVPDATVELLDAMAELQDGNPAAAIDHAAAAVAVDGAGAEEWIALVEAHFQSLAPLPREHVEALRSFEGTFENPQSRHEFMRAVALAELLSGQVSSGFETADANGVRKADLWRVTVALANDDDFLNAALPEGAKDGAEVTDDVAVELAERLLALGFPDAALDWLGPVIPEDRAEKRRVAAKAELARGNARRALELLSGLTGDDDTVQRALVMVELGRISEAREAYLAVDMQDEAMRLAAWEGDWEHLVETDTPLWTEAAAKAAPTKGTMDGPLARGAALLEASATSRTVIDDLLAGVPRPDP